MVPQLILIAPCFRVIDQFMADPASASANLTGHQPVFNKY